MYQKPRLKPTPQNLCFTLFIAVLRLHLLQIAMLQLASLACLNYCRPCSLQKVFKCQKVPLVKGEVGSWKSNSSPISEF